MTAIEEFTHTNELLMKQYEKEKQRRKEVEEVREQGRTQDLIQGVSKWLRAKRARKIERPRPLLGPRPLINDRRLAYFSNSLPDSRRF